MRAFVDLQAKAVTIVFKEYPHGYPCPFLPLELVPSRPLPRFPTLPLCSGNISTDTPVRFRPWN